MISVSSSVRRGFTLIELLVVIAIIGILSSVVLASLNSARQRGADAAIESNLSNARTQAELFYDSNNNSYATVCTTGTNNIAALVAAAGAQSGVAAVCGNSATAWGAAARLKSDTGKWFCVDSTGAGKEVTSATSPIVASTDLTC